MGHGPLDGIRVIDLSIAGTGPYAAVLLADQGADVVKVERPGIGDIARWVGATRNGSSALYQICNRGKRSIALDVGKPEGRDVVRRLARDADVVVQNFRPGVVERLGVGYDDLRAEREDLVYLSISGFGPDGPYADKSAYDTVIQAYSGIAVTQADPGTGEPRFVNQVIADKITALTASQAVTAALLGRERGLGGQHVQVAMLDAVVSFLWIDAAGDQVILDGENLPSNVGSPSPIRFSDGWGIVTPTGDADFAGMCRAFGVEGYDDPRVATIGQRIQHRELTTELWLKCNANAASLSTDEAMARLERERVPCGVVLSSAELVRDPHAQAVGLFVEGDHPVVGRIRQPRHATRFGTTPVDGPGMAPTLGQHTDEILTEVGLGDRIDELRAAGVVA